MSNLTGKASTAEVSVETNDNSLDGAVELLFSVIKGSTWVELIKTNDDVRTAMVKAILPLFTTPQRLVDANGKAILDANGQEIHATPIEAAEVVGDLYLKGKQTAKHLANANATVAKAIAETMVNIHEGKTKKVKDENGVVSVVKMEPCYIDKVKLERFQAADALIGQAFKRSRSPWGGIYTLAKAADAVETFKAELA